ncbi:MAG: hypothetical protein PHU47_01495, partial [Candidatus ainarchaeum sp.]|nr:hypothetical protein [Candidatus ainarchaeum sp.]
RGQLDRRTVQNLSGLNKDCVSFVAGPGIVKSDNGEFITIKGSYRKMDVYVYCNQTAHNGLNVVNSSYPEVNTDLTRNDNNPFDICPTFCVFFFNKKPVNDIYNN